jgi:hypothetical protein
MTVRNVRPVRYVPCCLTYIDVEFNDNYSSQINLTIASIDCTYSELESHLFVDENIDRLHVRIELVYTSLLLDHNSIGYQPFPWGLNI